MLKRILYIISGLAVLLVILGSAVFLWFIVIHPGDELLQSNIEKILAMESPVFYNDGQSKIGVFFKDAHRQYISYSNIPKDFINAIVAAEDNAFFTHFGVDIFGILRALYANLQAGKIVQGGSTITQQTAKNLFKRKSRSFSSKFKELMFALRLEYHYSKEKILEFYVNQFFVSGNGHGLGMAARYYFDKQVSELDLLECAFIAGSVKRPNSYNPFIKKDEDAVRMALKRAQKRTDYVLGQMRKLGFIDVDQYQTQLAREITFKKGKMIYPLNTLMDMVKSALNEPEVEEALAQSGIDNVATSGIRIITTVDKNLQDDAIHALRKELARLDVRLKGYEREEVQNYYNKLSYVGDREIRPGSFIFGTITAINRSSSPFVDVNLTGKNKKGRIDEAGLMPLLNSLIKWQKHRWSEADQFDLPEILNRLQIGDKVFVSIRDVEPESGDYLFDLEKYPEIQGAVLAIKEGTIQALVGGMENHFFNRAVSAKRPMGSIMKPLVYAAALQLGWNNLDALNNSRNLFVYQKQPYFPRPDHFSPHDQVSMNWAGVHSENVATVWLLYHLCDHLTPGQFKDLTANLGLARQPDESYEQYKEKIRDEYGIVVDSEALYRAAFKKATKELETDLIFAGKLNEYESVKTLRYGLNFEQFLEELEELTAPSYETEERQKKIVEKEIEVRKNILKRSFLSFMQLRQELRDLQKDISIYDSGDMTGGLYYNRQSDSYIFASEIPTTGDWHYVDKFEFASIVHQSMIRKSPPTAYEPWNSIPNSEIPPMQSFRMMDSESYNEFWNSILIEGMLHPATLDLLNSNLEKEYERLAALPPYNPQVLHNIDDFRITVGLIYLTSLSKALGIMSVLDPVLSFPLGSNVISLLETARMYEGLMTGSITVDTTGGSADELMIIERIEDSDGEIIYTPERKPKKVFDTKTTLAINHILRNVVKYGTGQYANRNIRLQSRDPERNRQLNQLDLIVPVFGKTGTANRFTNSAFAGYVPGVTPKGNSVTIKDGYTVAAYVGYDNNMPMVHTTTHITGAGGALPVWTRLANSILFEKNYSSGLDLIDATFTAAATNGHPELMLLEPKLGQIQVPVNKDNGLKASKTTLDTPTQNMQKEVPVVTFGDIKSDGEFKPLRYFIPFWAQNF